MLQFCRVVERDRVCMYQYEKASRRIDGRTDDTTSGGDVRGEWKTGGWVGWTEGWSTIKKWVWGGEVRGRKNDKK